MTLLNNGTTIRLLDTGATCTVESYIGSGGQGEVYRADLNGRKVALKWYYTASASNEQFSNLRTLVRQPQPNQRFLWPMDVAEADGVENFGYLMPLRDERYKSLFDLMHRRVDPSFRSLITAGRQLADSFHHLHALGLCYQDISFGNVFFDPDTGEILICDNDNVVPNGTVTGIVGTPDFMAPEIVRGEAKPSTNTDLFSLSVLLFYLFHIHHPLYGKKLLNIHVLDLPARRKLCGTDPVFIFDPVDKSNEAVGKTQDPLGEAGANALVFWPIYPLFLQSLFTKAFTNGLHDPQHGRVQESVWRKELTKLQNSLLYCGSCSSENFFDGEILIQNGRIDPCWSCGSEIVVPPRLAINNQEVMLNYDTKLYSYHVDVLTTDYDSSAEIAKVNQHPTDPTRWGLMNLQNQRWVITTEAGSMVDVHPGKSVPITAGTKINFGSAQGEIKA